MHGEAVWVDLTLDLLRGRQQPVDENEVRLAHLIEMLGAMNAIAVAAAVRPDGAQSPINKNVAMKARNARLRAAAA